MKTDYECATIIDDSDSSDEEYVLMPKKKRGAFNPIQIKEGWIVRLHKDGRIAERIEKYPPEKKK